jgi:hypothetical protein
MAITKIGRTIATATIAIGAISLTSCQVKSKNPLSDPDRSRPDPALYGNWLLQDPKTKKTVDDNGERVLVFLGKAAEADSGHFPAGIMRGVAIGFDKERVRRPMEFHFFVTQLRNGNYMNVFEEGPVYKKKYVEWDKSAIEEYFLLKYRVSDDKLEIWTGQFSAVRDAIENGKLRGKVTKHWLLPSAQLTDTTARLTEYLERTGGRELFTQEKDQPIVLIRGSIP